MTLTGIWFWGFSFGAMENVEYSFITKSNQTYLKKVKWWDFPLFIFPLKIISYLTLIFIRFCCEEKGYDSHVYMGLSLCLYLVNSLFSVVKKKKHDLKVFSKDDSLFHSNLFSLDLLAKKRFDERTRKEMNKTHSHLFNNILNHRINSSYGIQIKHSQKISIIKQVAEFYMKANFNQWQNW